MAIEKLATTVKVKIEKAEATAVNTALMLESGIPAELQDKGVFRIQLGLQCVMYYPGATKWMHRGKMYHGSPVDLKKWLIEKGLLP